MFTRGWAFFLILVCGFNAISVSGPVYLSEKAQETAGLTFQMQADTTPLATLGQTPSDKHEDCESQHGDTHQCHLGHCNFLVTSASGLVAPDLIRGLHYLATTSYFSIDLSGPRKPPRA